MGKYVKKTSRRRYDERHFSIRAVHREPPDLHKLSEMLIRLTLQEIGESRASRRADEVPETYREPKQETSTDRRRPEHPGPQPSSSAFAPAAHEAAGANSCGRLDGREPSGDRLG